MNRALTNVFIASFLAAITIDALPSMHLLHGRMKVLIDPLLDKAGLWQESWKLFGPDVDKMNSGVSATLIYSNGDTVEWQSPKWRELSSIQRFRHFREVAFYDRVKNDHNRDAWRSFARYLANQHIRDGEKPHKVSLTRHWVDIPRPLPGDHQPRQPLEFTGAYEFYLSRVSTPKK